MTSKFAHRSKCNAINTVAKQSVKQINSYIFYNYVDKASISNCENMTVLPLKVPNACRIRVLCKISSNTNVHEEA